MPLAFASRSHGTVAFGFFNIASDMLLLEQLFFFADRFCQAVVDLARARSEPATQPAASVLLDGWRIDSSSAIGNLHGAIAGTDLHGFIGESYRAHPFPSRREDFKQSPEGAESQQQMRELIARFGRAESIALAWSPAEGLVSVGEIVFDDAGFGALVGYVEQGGYPRYRDEVRPSYVTEMIEILSGLPVPWPA